MKNSSVAICCYQHFIFWLSILAVQWLLLCSLAIALSLAPTRAILASTIPSTVRHSDNEIRSSAHDNSDLNVDDNRRQHSDQLREQEQRRLEMEKAKVLAALGLSETPTVSMSLDDVPSHLIKRAAAMHPHIREPDDENYNRGLFIFGEKLTRAGSTSNQCIMFGRVSDCFQLRIKPNLLRSSQIYSAKLWVLKHDDANDHRNQTLAVIERRREGTEERTVSLFAANVGSGKGWKSIDMTDIVKSWLAPFMISDEATGAGLAADIQSTTTNESLVKTLDVVCETCEDTASARISFESTSRPFLEIKTERILQRQEREASLCTPGFYTRCCLRYFYVNFTTIGWRNWIIQPEGYEANYCMGSCTHQFNKPAYKIKTYAGAPACCSPKKYGPLTLLYADADNSLKTKILQEMTTKSCGC